MIIILKKDVTSEKIKQIEEKVKEKKLKPVLFEGESRKVMHATGDTEKVRTEDFAQIEGVESVMRVSKPYKLASREHHPEKTVVKIGDVSIGNGEFRMIAGPCSVETEEQIMRAATQMKKEGIKIMRASAFKPRTSPYDFQGLGIEGLKLLAKVREQTGLLVETEVMDVRDVPIAAQYCDALRVGARNMQNTDLLKELGKIDKPVILKRGMSATIKEFLNAAEYILAHGNKNVILCERGIRTFETAYRNTLDLGGVAVLQQETHLPIIVDPSHAAGQRDLLPAMCRASVAVGADGLIVETHPSPEEAWSDGAQSLTPEQFHNMLKEIEPVCKAVGRTLG